MTGRLDMNRLREIAQERLGRSLADATEDERWLMLEDLLTGDAGLRYRYSDFEDPHHWERIGFEPGPTMERASRPWHRHALDDLGPMASAVFAVMEELVKEACWPGLSREQWRRIGYDRAYLRPSFDPDGTVSIQGSVEAARRFIAKVRLAKAAGSTTGRL